MLMLMMDKAWNKGIAPSIFRQSRMSDLMFIKDMDNMREEVKQEIEHNEKIKQAMQAIKRR